MQLTFNSYCIGLEETSCFVCGGETTLQSNICAFVEPEERDQMITELFKSMGARAHGYYSNKIIVGACKSHDPHLEQLELITSRAGKIINPKIIAHCQSGKNFIDLPANLRPNSEETNKMSHEEIRNIIKEQQIFIEAAAKTQGLI